MIKVLGFQNVQGTHNVTFKVLPLCTTSIPPHCSYSGHISGTLAGVLGVAQQPGNTLVVWLWDTAALF